MANTLTPNFNYTYDGITSTEVFYKPTVLTPDVLQIFKVLTGVKSKQQLNLVAPLSNITKADQGCGTTETGTGIQITNRTLETCSFEVFLSQCYDVFEGNVMENLLKSGNGTPDLTGTGIQTILENVIKDGMRRDAFKFFSFGDTDSVNTNLNVCDGLWTRLIAGVASYEVDRISTIGSNLSQTANQRALDYFKLLFEGADITLKQMPVGEKKFFVTGTIFENYLTTLETLNNAEGGWKIVQDGLPRAFYRGIEVVPIYAWDSIITEFSLGSPNRILYTTPANHVIGVERAQDQSEMEIWYEKKDKKVYIRGMYRMGYNYVQNDLQAISY